jgi:acetolactate synthase-1/3 small subunit
MSNNKQKHILAIIVENVPGVLARVIGLFSGRGYNIDSLTVSTIDDSDKLSRITVATFCDEHIIEQIQSQIDRLIPVVKVENLNDDYIERELSLVKVIASGEKRVEALRTADIFRCRVLDSSAEHFIFEVTGHSKKIRAFEKLMSGLGEVEKVSTGSVAVHRGAAMLSIDQD